MKKFFPFLIVLLLVVNVKFSFSQFVYVNPLPGSRNHMPEVTITLNPGGDVIKSSLGKEGLFNITATKSGRHEFTTILSPDGHTIILKPRVPFVNDEEATVTIGDGIMLKDGKEVKGTSFSFTTRKALTSEEKAISNNGPLDFEDPQFTKKNNPEEVQAKLTPGTPPFIITVNNNPAPGSFFFSNEQSDESAPAYLTIMDNDTITQFSRENNQKGNDWKMNDNHLFTYYDDTSFSWIMLDSSYNPVDTFQCGNGYAAYTNRHEFRIYPDGHAYIFAYDEQFIDMSQYVAGGSNHARVIGFTLQRLDANKNVVFEWRSWDHFQFTDAVWQVSLTSGVIDWVHGNSVDEDTDGNILLSFRHLSEITKVNSTTGAIIWRMGGENNQFTFVNDISTTPFYYQHYVRRLANGHILFFNNNNYQSPLESSAKEYAVNEVTHVATLVWYFKHAATNGHLVYGRAGGSAQRLSNGNTVINWGLVQATAGNPNFTEVDPAGNIVYEFRFIDSNEIFYRVTKHEWEACDKPSFLKVTKLTSNSAKLSWNDTHGSVEYELGYKILGAAKYKKLHPQTLSRKLTDLAAGTTYTAYVKSICDYSRVRKSPQFNVNFTTQAKLSDEHLPETSLSIYPNPATDQVSIAFTNADGAPVNIRIVNLVGETVYENHLVQPDDDIYQVNLKSLPSGLYMCEVENSSGKILQKLVKQ